MKKLEYIDFYKAIESGGKQIFKKNNYNFDSMFPYSYQLKYNFDSKKSDFCQQNKPRTHKVFINIINEDKNVYIIERPSMVDETKFQEMTTLEKDIYLYKLQSDDIIINININKIDRSSLFFYLINIFVRIKYYCSEFQKFSQEYMNEFSLTNYPGRYATLTGFEKYLEKYNEYIIFISDTNLITSISNNNKTSDIKDILTYSVTESNKTKDDLLFFETIKFQIIYVLKHIQYETLETSGLDFNVMSSFVAMTDYDYERLVDETIEIFQDYYKKLLNFIKEPFTEMLNKYINYENLLAKKLRN